MWKEKSLKPRLIKFLLRDEILEFVRKVEERLGFKRGSKIYPPEVTWVDARWPLLSLEAKLRILCILYGHVPRYLSHRGIHRGGFIN